MAETRPMQLEAPGLWVEIRAAATGRSPRPALFLDRDGTIIPDASYPRVPSRVALVPDILPALRAANAADLPIVIVSNQSGIARGRLSWADFAAVNARLLELLAAAGCSVAAVLACAYYRSTDAALDVEDHPMRKPNPGMLQLAAERLAIDLEGSLIAGDKASDLAAGCRAGLRRGFLIGAAEASDVPTGFQWSRIAAPDDWATLAEAVSAYGRPR